MKLSTLLMVQLRMMEFDLISKVLNNCQDTDNNNFMSNNNSKSKFKRRNKRTGTLNVTKSKNSPVKEAIKKSLRKTCAVQ